MKKLLFIVVFAVAAMAATAQRGTVTTVDVDTLQGDESVDFVEIGPLTGVYESISISALCTQLGGASDGTLAVYGSNDGTNYVLINGVSAGVITASPQDDLTGSDLNQVDISDDLVANWVIKGSPHRYYKVRGVGTDSDTTQVDITYIIK